MTLSNQQRLKVWAIGYPGAAALLILYAVMALTASLNKCTTYDEIAHLTAGYAYWDQNDYRLQPENGNLPQRVEALPVWLGGYRFPSIHQDSWTKSDVWTLGDEFFYSLRNDPQSILLLGRCAIAVLAVLLGLLVYHWSRMLFGPVGGIISLLLYVFCPTMLAHGALATSDLTAALFFVASLWGVWRVLHDVRPTTVLLSSFCLAGLLISKTSAPLLFPVAAVLLVLRLIVGRPLPVKLHRSWAIEQRGRQLAVFAVIAVIHAAVAFAVIWTAYGFRYEAFNPAAGGGHFLEDFDGYLKNTGIAGDVLSWFRTQHLLPEAYIYGTVFVIFRAGTRSAFLNGQWSLHGWPEFFPYAFLAKTALSTLALLALAGIAALAGFFKPWREKAASFGSALGRGLYATAPLWLLLAVYWFTMIRSHLNIGHRHLLPVYPLFFVLAGSLAALWNHRWRIGKIAVLALLAGLVIESLCIYPNYLAFFNVAAGGPNNGYKHLVDSSLDWGQDLPGLKKWLDDDQLKHPGQPVYLSYFGNGSPKYYQIQALTLPGLPRRYDQIHWEPLRGGVYCISATQVESVYTVPMGHWAAPLEAYYQKLVAVVKDIERRKAQSPDGKLVFNSNDERQQIANLLAQYEDFRFARLCAYLRHREPDAQVGHTILIYRLSDAEVKQAVDGPPAEFFDKPQPDMEEEARLRQQNR